MKKYSNRRKLTLSKTTIRRISRTGLARAIGGIEPPPQQQQQNDNPTQLLCGSQSDEQCLVTFLDC